MDHWPLFGLRITTERLELRPPDQDLLVAIADLAALGIHDPGTMPFEVPWTDVAPPEQQRNTLQWGWRTWAAFTADGWALPFAVLVDGEVVGVQSLMAERFATMRVVTTGSWLGMAHQGRGIGKEMRRAVLHLAFDHLGAVRAETAAWHDNPSSQGVSRSVGYRPNGDRVALRRDEPTRQLRFVLERDDWTAAAGDGRPAPRVTGLEPCRPLLGC